MNNILLVASYYFRGPHKDIFGIPELIVIALMTFFLYGMTYLIFWVWNRLKQGKETQKRIKPKKKDP